MTRNYALASSAVLALQTGRSGTMGLCVDSGAGGWRRCGRDKGALGGPEERSTALCQSPACPELHELARYTRVDSCGAVILHPGALEPRQGSGALVVWLRTGEPVVPDSQCHTAATTLLVSPTDWLTDCGPLLGLGCSRSAAALVSRKWEQVVGAACSVVSGGVVTEVEANFACLAGQGTPTLASVGVSFSNELAAMKQTKSRFYGQFSSNKCPFYNQATKFTMNISPIPRFLV